MHGPGSAVDTAETILTAAADGSYKSRIPLSASYVQVAAYTTNADDYIILPSGVRPGHKVRGWSTVQHELRTEASSNVEINSEDGDGTKEALIPATTLWEATYVNATIGWILVAWDELAAPVTAIVPD